ncbi:MAG: heme-binding protein [Planctomycetes bacterium]|nr:heme-binding protein [Planctomycetota bacterium]
MVAMAPISSWKVRVARGAAFGLLAAAGLGLPSCSGKTTSTPVGFVTGGPAIPLTAPEVSRIIQRAVNAVEAAAGADTFDVHVAVTDRTGDILGAFSTVGGAAADDDDIAVSLARTTSYFSNSQAPLSSRTVETLGAFHFPPTFASELIASQAPNSGASIGGNTVIAPTRRITGVAGTPQGPLWQINATNRGADIATNLTTPPTLYNTGVSVPPPPGEPVELNTGNIFFNPSRNIGGTFPSPGITLLPGGIPLFKANGAAVPRLVGGVGVYVVFNSGPNAGQPFVAAGEFAAIQGAKPDPTVLGDPDFFFDDIPLEGAITIVGVLLPYVQQVTRPAGTQARTAAAPGAFVSAVVAGREDPFGFLIGPRDGQTGNGGVLLTQADVSKIIGQVVASANITRGQVRLPLGSSARVIATVVDARGLILAHYRMEDTLCDAIDVVPAKARSVVYYCRPGGPFATATTTQGFPFPNGDQWPGFPLGDARGIALTTRTLGFLSQPFYPPGIGGTFSQAEYIAALPNFTPATGNTAPGPLYNLALLNQLDSQVDRWGNDAPDPGYQNGLTFFPGSVPLYKADVNGVKHLVGALGVSGDGVEQNDLIAADGGVGFEPPPELRIDNFEFQGVKLPYLKFPQTPR